MKLTLILLSLSLSLFASNSNKPVKLICEDGYPFESVRIDLNPHIYSGDFNRATGASLNYNYSGVNQMVCSGYARGNDYKINCAGYYATGELTEIKVRTVDSKIIVFWKTSQGYGNQNMELECTPQYK